MTHYLDHQPAPAPLPYSSQAGRGEIPAAPTLTPADRLSGAPGAPRMREDEFSFWLAAGFVGFFIVIMMLVALMGGL